MAAVTTAEAIEALVATDGDAHLVRPEVSALEAISRSEVAMQLDSAHRWPRSATKFLREATSLATLSVEIAESCMYSVPRGGKMLTGPSVRLAEICAASWGNLHVGARVIDANETEVVAQAVAWDLEKNVRVTIEAQRSIVGKRGRFDDDMIRVTGMAAISIAMRNAIFRVIPRAYVETVYAKAKAVAVGDAKTLGARRDDLLARLGKMGVTQDRVLARLELKGVDDITLEHVETLIGIGTAIKSGDMQLDQAFPQAAPSPVPPGTPEGRRIKLNKKQPAGGNPADTNGAAAPAKESGSSPPLQTAPAPAAAPVDLTKLVQMLNELDDSWGEYDGTSVVASWTEKQRREALDWASACLNDGTMATQANRPAHTLIGRQPGED